MDKIKNVNRISDPLVTRKKKYSSIVQSFFKKDRTNIHALKRKRF